MINVSYMRLSGEVPARLRLASLKFKDNISILAIFARQTGHKTQPGFMFQTTTNMLYLLAAILCGAFISISFKLFRKFGIDSLQGIFVNYLTAMAVSIALSGQGVDLGAIFGTAVSSSWLWLAIIEGFFFMGGILVMAVSTQRTGLAVTNVAARASMIIPVIASYLAYRQGQPRWLLIAVIIASMVMIFGSSSDRKDLKARDIIPPLGVFLFFGICDFLLKVLKTMLGDSPEGNAMLFIFSTAALFCLVAYLVRGHFREHPLNWKAIPGGLFLGLVNSGCTAFMMKALGVMDSAVFYPSYNVGVVLVTLLTGIFVFREKLRGVQFAGIAVALVAMVLLLTL